MEFQCIFRLRCLIFVSGGQKQNIVEGCMVNPNNFWVTNKQPIHNHHYAQISKGVLFKPNCHMRPKGVSELLVLVFSLYAQWIG